jgi:hypothetical protein
MTETAFYTVTGRDFFPGAVALLNSLRLVGHAEPLFVLDSGMEPAQRALLEQHATIVPAPRDAPPSLLKLEAPLTRGARTLVLLDADIIVTRPLTELIERASQGFLVGFENDRQRFFPEWANLLGLEGLRPAPYLSTSALFVDGALAETFMPLARQRQTSVDRRGTWLGRGSESHPLYYLDQDVLNAVVASHLVADQVVALDRRLSANPPFQGLRLIEPASLRCTYRDGTDPYMLHHWSKKPWLVRMRSNVYSRLLTRLLLSSDVALRLSASDLPRRRRTGPAARAERAGIDIALLVPGMRRRLRRTPSVVTAWPDSRPVSDEGPGT